MPKKICLLPPEEKYRYKEAVLDLYKRAGGVLSSSSTSLVIEVKNFLKIRVNFQVPCIDIIDDVNDIWTNYSTDISFIDFFLGEILKENVVKDRKNLFHQEQKVACVSSENKNHILDVVVRCSELFIPFENDKEIIFFIEDTKFTIDKSSKKLYYKKYNIVSFEIELDDSTYEKIIERLEKNEKLVSISDAIKKLNSLCLTSGKKSGKTKKVVKQSRNNKLIKL